MLATSTGTIGIGTQRTSIRKRPTQAEFDGAFLRLQERHEPLSKERYHDLTKEEKEHLLLLEQDCPELKRHDHDTLREHALSRGIDLGKDAYRKRAPVVYMAMLLTKLGFSSLEDVFEQYPQLRPLG